MINDKKHNSVDLIASLLIGFTFSAFSFIFSGIYFENKVKNIIDEKLKNTESVSTNKNDNSKNNELTDLNQDGKIDLLDEAILKQQKEKEKQISESRANLTTIKDDDYFIGNKDAKIMILEYSDSDCPYCSSYHKTLKKLLEDYSDKIVWVYRHFPLDSLHPNSRGKAEAFECAGEQGKFWDLVNKSYENQKASLSDFETWVSDFGMNVNQYKECVSSKKYADKVESQYKDAQKLGASGTPFSLFVGDKSKNEIYELPGAVAYENLKSIVDAYFNRNK